MIERRTQSSLAASQRVVGDVERVVRFVIRLVLFEEMEVVVNRLDQTGIAECAG